MIRGKHDIKIGGNIRANQMNVGTEGFQDGFWVISGGFSGNPVADFMQGITSLAIHDQTFPTDSQYPGGPVTGRRWKIYRPYVQDDWRITKSLTLNLGLGVGSDDADLRRTLAPGKSRRRNGTTLDPRRARNWSGRWNPDELDGI